MNKGLFIVIVVMLSVVFVTNYYIFYYQKDYDFLVEASCDPLVSKCFVRDCNSDEGCPPNNLESYRVFNIKASDFASCKDDSCLQECENGVLSCLEILCGNSPDDVCSTSE